MTPYYWLLTRESDGKWSPQFGDYVRRVVHDEARDTYRRDYKARDILVIKAPDDTQAALAVIISEMNAKD